MELINIEAYVTLFGTVTYATSDKKMLNQSWNYIKENIMDLQEFEIEYGLGIWVFFFLFFFVKLIYATAKKLILTYLLYI